MNIKKLSTILIIAGSIICLLGLGGYILWLNKEREFLSLSLSQAKKTQAGLQADTNRLIEENDDLQKQLDKIQADALNYVATNTKLQLEKEDLEKKVEATEEEIRKKEADLAGIRSDASQIQAQDYIKLKKDIARLKSENKAVCARLKSTQEEIEQSRSRALAEKAALYYNLGVSYTQEKLYDEAVSAFEKSLEYGPVNPQANYNLGLIFENIKFDSQSAVLHYRQYLKQSPLAEDRGEVEGWVEKLQ